MVQYEYRIGHILGKCCIERREIGTEKWKLLFGNISIKDAHELIKDPQKIEDINKGLNFIGYFILSVFILTILILVI